MANLNLWKDVANKREKIVIAFLLWPNLIPYIKLQECVVTVLLLTSTHLQVTTIEVVGSRIGISGIRNLLGENSLHIKF